jgi:hypothetical protein
MKKAQGGRGEGGEVRPEPRAETTTVLYLPSPTALLPLQRLVVVDGLGEERTGLTPSMRYEGSTTCLEGEEGRRADSFTVAGGWFVMREEYCWLVADKPSEHGVSMET